MKPWLLLFILLSLLAAYLGAQTIHEPNSEIYKDIDHWFVQGYIREFLPLLRPYPAPLIDKILNEVIENGDAPAREKAAQYRRLTTEPGSRGIYPGLLGYVEGKNDEHGILAAPFAEGLFQITDILSLSYHLALYGMTDQQGERFNVPGTYTPYSDFITDVANVGNVELRPQWTSLVSIMKNDVYFQAGLSRSSIGPFYDNGIVAGPQSPRAGHFGFAFLRPRWSFELLFQSISATDDFGQGLFSNKYNVIHNISFRPIESLELGFIQTMVWGKRIDPLYLVPFSFLFASQSITDFEDNSFMGLHLRWRPFDNFLANGQVYADDISFNGIIKGEYRFKLAGEAGVSWAPKKNSLSRLDFDYTAVFPYTYTHWQVPDQYRYNHDGQSSTYNPTNNSPNYLNYTHLGRNIGPDMEPNSDRISLRTYWAPLPSINMGLSAYLTRHGNVSEGLSGLDKDLHDGSIFDDGSMDPWLTDSDDLHNPHPNLFLLTQDVLDIRLGGGIGITWALPIPAAFGVLRLSAEYGAQYGWNRSRAPDRRPEKDNNGLDHFWSFGGIWSW